MNNPFGLPDAVFNAILESAMTGAVVTNMKNAKPDVTPAAPKQNTPPEDGAKAAKEIYDSYVKAGFNEVQAFELLKLVLSK